jgi:hypothetical protein
MSLREPGRVVEFKTGLQWRVIFPDVEHLAVSSYLRELAASDCSPSTLRSYGFDLLRGLRFLHRRMTAWERADRLDVREFVEWLRETPNPQRLRRRPDAPPPGSVNPVTGKPVLPVKYASRTMNHQLSVLFGFYEFACVAGDTRRRRGRVVFTAAATGIGRWVCTRRPSRAAPHRGDDLQRRSAPR